MLVFYVFALLLIWQSVASLVGGLRFRRYVARELRRPPIVFAPFASILIPCRGLDDGLRENLRPLWRQDYPHYELIFIFDSATDEARRIIESLCVEHEHTEQGVRRVCFVIAGQATDSGQKVHNLRAGVQATDKLSEVFVFFDTDARPGAGWLRALVAGLADGEAGAATGYRWFVPRGASAGALLRSVWNASITSALGADTRRNFCWGGSTAIRRQTFEELNVAERWRGTLPDDFALTRMLREAKLPIRFVPRCLVPSYEGCTLGELVEFTTRQIKITRAYAAPLWQIVLWSNLIFTSVFFGGIALGAKGLIAGERFPLPLVLVAVVYLLGAAKAFLRWRAVQRALAPHAAGGALAMCAHLFLFPLTAVLYLYNAVAALLSSRITWRGIEYELKSATETAIIRPARHTPFVAEANSESDIAT